MNRLKIQSRRIRWESEVKWSTEKEGQHLEMGYINIALGQLLPK